ncbi:MAG: alpha-isopropylmalate synthase regulatory domain-containing protein [Acidimicrobiales bacterium]
MKLWVGDERRVAVGEGNGPVNALDAAVRGALDGRYPELDRITLTDFKVRVLNTEKGTSAVTRVLLDSTNGERSWSTIGVSENIIEASWQALVRLARLRPPPHRLIRAPRSLRCTAMSAPAFVPGRPGHQKHYRSRSTAWWLVSVAPRRGGRRGPASGPAVGNQGPDQGYVLKLAASLRDKLVLTPREQGGRHAGRRPRSRCAVPRSTAGRP